MIPMSSTAPAEQATHLASPELVDAIAAEIATGPATWWELRGAPQFRGAVTFDMQAAIHQLIVAERIRVGFRNGETVYEENAR